MDGSSYKLIRDTIINSCVSFRNTGAERFLDSEFVPYNKNRLCIILAYSAIKCEHKKFENIGYSYSCLKYGKNSKQSCPVLSNKVEIVLFSSIQNKDFKRTDLFHSVKTMATKNKKRIVIIRFSNIVENLYSDSPSFLLEEVDS